MNNEKHSHKPQRGPGPGGPNMGMVQKPKNFKESIKKLFAYSKQYRAMIVVAVILSIIASVFSLMGPSKLSDIAELIMTGMQNGIDLEAVSSIAIFLVIIYGLSLIFGYAQGNIIATVAQNVSRNLRSDLVRKINKLPLSYFDTRSYGDTLSHITNDVDTISTSLNQSLSSLVSGIFMFIGALILMLYTNWIMAITALVSSSVGFILMGGIIGRSQKYFKAQQKELGKLNGHIEEIYTGHTIVKAYNGEAFAKEHFDKENESLRTAAWKAQFISGLMMPIMNFVGNFSYVAVCIVGAILTMQNVISFSVVIAFMVYVRLFTQPLSTLAQAANVLQSAAAASERVFELLEETELTPEHDNLSGKTSADGNIKFENVEFGYNKDKLIIKGLSADIKAGQKVAIVGPTGAGKTTIVNLIMRFYEINSGKISLDGVDIRDIKREDLHQMFAMVLQDTWMFEGTVKENIAYSEENVSDADIIKACKSVGIHHTIMTLSKGYDTYMSNATLSDGEKQLITIARAMVKKSELLILDEATSSVDTRTELLINEAMDKLSENKTTFIIAHRLSTIKNADLILVMKDGNVIESGNHEKLLEENGFYAQLYNSQFEQTA